MGPGHVTLDVVHACGHKALHEYTNKETAEIDKPRQENKKCLSCRQGYRR